MAAETRITEVIISYETWNCWWWAQICVYTRTLESTISVSFIRHSCKSPNVFTWVLTMSQAHSIDVGVFKTVGIIVESNGSGTLIRNGSSIHMTVLYSMNSEKVCNTSIACYIAQSLWCRASRHQGQPTGTLVAGVPHVYIGHPHPASCVISTDRTHVTVHPDRRARRADPVVARRGFWILVIQSFT